jgi:hypothetical protein
MKRASGILILTCMIFTLPFICLTNVSSDEGPVLMTLDVCSLGCQATIDAAPALAELVFDVPALQHVTSLTEDSSVSNPFVLAFLIDKPPIV